MSAIIYDILGQLNENDNLLTKNPFLGASSMLSNKDISNYELSSIDRGRYIYIKNIRNDGDLLLGQKFDVIFSKNNPKEYIKVESEVDFLSLRKGDNIGIMPDGQGGVVRLRFKDKVPEIIKFLKQNDDEKFDTEKHQYLFFTTQEVMDKILEELEKAEKA